MGAALPAALKLLNGRTPGTDSGGRKVPIPPAFKRTPPKPPKWLTASALEEWEFVLPALSRLDLIKEIDGSALAAYCESVALLRMCVETIDQEGIATVELDGSTKMNPAVASMLKATAQVRSWAQEFGLTPVAEMKLASAPEVPDDNSGF